MFCDAEPTSHISRDPGERSPVATSASPDACFANTFAGLAPHFFVVDRNMNFVGAAAADPIDQYLRFALPHLKSFAGARVPSIIELGHDCRLRIVEIDGATSGLMVVFVETSRLAVALRKTVERYQLTPREAAVLRLMAESLSNVEIAAQLGIAPSTTADHIASLARKMECVRRSQVVQKLFAH